MPRTQLIDFYQSSFNEDQRHQDLFGKIQEARTKEILRRYLPSPGQRILDIGGATGVYSFYLAQEGHEVTLLDIVPEHISVAQAKAQSLGLKNLQCILSDILDFPTDIPPFDLIISHGPMYHLLDPQDRIASMRKVQALLKESGTALTFGINRYAGFFYGMVSGRIAEPEYYSSVKKEIESGVRPLPPGWYFHTPDRMSQEVEAAGLKVIKTIGVVGPSWMYPHGDERWKEETGRGKILEIARLVENEPLIGPDLCCIAQKRPAQ
jgi:cyclopropane fatty-acyl-phospholipid synthase-like methyltransferase